MGRSGRIALTLLLLAVSGACTPADQRTTLIVDPSVALIDVTIRVSIHGLDAGESVVVQSQSRDYAGAEWHAQATFTADDRGWVDLATAKPVEGSYVGADPTGLFWSMDPVTGADDTSTLYLKDPEFTVELTATPAHSRPASATVRLMLDGPDVRHDSLTIADDGVVGELYRPNRPSAGSVLLLGGSEGGISTGVTAMLLAAHGFTALALGYFALPGLPATLKDIPIEYFAAAARLLPAPVRVIGYSRGSEAALLLAALYPGLIRATVVCAPADRIHAAFPGPGNAWTHDGKPQQHIPFDRITGPVLALAGASDQLWPSGSAAIALQRLVGATAKLYPNAGHVVCGLPNLPAGTSLRHPVTGDTYDLGGTRLGNNAARQQSWVSTLAFLRT